MVCPMKSVCDSIRNQFKCLRSTASSDICDIMRQDSDAKREITDSDDSISDSANREITQVHVPTWSRL
jgi:hypothetical protein